MCNLRYDQLSVGVSDYTFAHKFPCRVFVDHLLDAYFFGRSMFLNNV